MQIRRKYRLAAEALFEVNAALDQLVRQSCIAQGCSDNNDKVADRIIGLVYSKACTKLNLKRKPVPIRISMDLKSMKDWSVLMEDSAMEQAALLVPKLIKRIRRTYLSPKNMVHMIDDPIAHAISILSKDIADALDRKDYKKTLVCVISVDKQLNQLDAHQWNIYAGSLQPIASAIEDMVGCNASL